MIVGVYECAGGTQIVDIIHVITINNLFVHI